MTDGEQLDELVRLAARQASALDTIRNVLIGFAVVMVLSGLYWIALARG
jgi:hypothetical protein